MQFNLRNRQGVVGTLLHYLNSSLNCLKCLLGFLVILYVWQWYGMDTVTGIQPDTVPSTPSTPRINDFSPVTEFYRRLAYLFHVWKPAVGNPLNHPLLAEAAACRTQEIFIMNFLSVFSNDEDLLLYALHQLEQAKVPGSQQAVRDQALTLLRHLRLVYFEQPSIVVDWPSTQATSSALTSPLVSSNGSTLPADSPHLTRTMYDFLFAESAHRSLPELTSHPITMDHMTSHRIHMDDLSESLASWASVSQSHDPS